MPSDTGATPPKINTFSEASPNSSHPRRKLLIIHIRSQARRAVAAETLISLNPGRATRRWFGGGRHAAKSRSLVILICRVRYHWWDEV
jgi:hypothetical protein